MPKIKKSSKIKSNEKSKTKSKVKSKSVKTEKEPEFNRNRALSQFLAKQSVEIENSLQMVSNSIIEPKGLSSGVLQLDWLFGGRFLPGLHSLAGEEQSGKSTLEFHLVANAYSVSKLPYICFQDAEGSVSPKYTGNIWEPFGMDVKHLLSKKGREEGFFYFRNNIIEKCFDYIKRTLSMMPDKLWCSEAKSWAYYFPKRDERAKALINAMQLKVDKTLSGTSPFYVCLTDNDGPEGFIAIDSFAAMLTRDEEEKEDSTKGKRSALEAAAFSEHLKRIKVDIFEKKIVLVGTNQLGSHVRAVYGSPDDQFYEKMGNSLRYYSDGRARTFSRSPSAGAKHGPFTYDKDSAKFGIEDSVEYKGTDRYAYKEVKNTKNKFGKPGLKTLIRVWVSDATGKPRGIDPVFDVWMHLRNTGQLGKDGKGFKFRLKPGVGKKRAGLLNSLAPFKFSSFKKLVIAEYTNNNDLLREALAELSLNVKPDLRNALFKQMVDYEEEVYSNIRDASKTESEDMEDDDVEDYEEV